MKEHRPDNPTKGQYLRQTKEQAARRLGNGSNGAFTVTREGLIIADQGQALGTNYKKAMIASQSADCAKKEMKKFESVAILHKQMHRIACQRSYQ